VVLLWCGVNRLIGRFSIISVVEMGKTHYWVLDLSGAGAPSPSGFFLLFKQTCVALANGRRRISWQLGPCISRNPVITQYPHLWGRTNCGLAQTTEPTGHKPLVVNVVVVGPFEEEEEGISVASDVVQAEGEDPNTPGYLRGDRVRLGRRWSRIVGASPLSRSRWSPGTVHNDSPILV